MIKNWLYHLLCLAGMFIVVSCQSLAPFQTTPGAPRRQGNETPTAYLPVITREYRTSARTWPETTNRIMVFNDQLNPAMTDAQFRFAATHYAGAQKMLLKDTLRLRQFNPDFLVLHYRLGQALGHSVPVNCRPSTDFLSIIQGNEWIREYPGDAVVQENWFFHWNNKRVFNCDWGHYLMNLEDPGWRSWWSDQVMKQLQANENDGVFADSYNIPNYGFTWNPALPEVDESFESAWAARQRSFTDYIQSRFAGRWKWIPNIGAWITTRDPSNYNNADGVMIEGFAAWGDGDYFGEEDWILQMNRLLPLLRSDKIILAQTYTNPSHLNDRLFVLGSYLLVKGKYTYINLEMAEEPEWFPEFGINLGTPVDPLPANIASFRDAESGIYVRRYSLGMVLVNPSDQARTYNPGGVFQQVIQSGGGLVPEDGTAPGSLSYRAVSSLTLPACQAAILLNRTP
ncbi:MAG TPA: putative glycoside hydrolase [Anaerolineaceae bacterium]